VVVGGVQSLLPTMLGLSPVLDVTYLVLVTVIKVRYDTHDTLKEQWSDEGMTHVCMEKQ
jgi:hypothetical protein